MAISLEAFQRAATIGGRITLDKRQDDGLNASNGQMGGKSVAWVKDTWPSSAVKEENRAAIQSFVGSVRAKYGDLLGDLAMARLAGDIQTGRPLTEQTITMIVTASDKALVDLAKMNEASARTAAKSDDPQKPGSFGQVFDQVTRAMGSSVKISDLDPGRLADARLAIEAGIKAETSQHGIPNLALVDDDVAQAIATREIKKLLGVDARDTMSRELTTPGDGTTPFDKAFAKELTARGFTQLTHKAFELGPLLQATRSAIVEASFNPNENAHTRPVDRAKADAILEQQIKRSSMGSRTRFLKAKQLAARPGAGDGADPSGDDRGHDASNAGEDLPVPAGGGDSTQDIGQSLGQSRQSGEGAEEPRGRGRQCGARPAARWAWCRALPQRARGLRARHPGTQRAGEGERQAGADLGRAHRRGGRPDAREEPGPASGGAPGGPGPRRRLQAAAAGARGRESPRPGLTVLSQASSQALDALKDNGIDLRWTRTMASPEAQMARKAKDLAGGNDTYKAALDQLVQLPGMTAARLEKLWEVRGTAESALAVLADPNKGLADQVGALKDLNTAIAKGAGDLNFDAEHADWLGQAAMWLARETTGLDFAALGQMRQTLVSPETTALLGALDLASRSQSLPQESRQAAGDLSRLLGELRPTMVGGSLPQPQLASLDQVKPELFQALRDNGVEIEPRMAKAKELAGSNAKHEAALTGLVQQNPSMTTETVEKLWQARGAAEQAFRAIAGGHTLADQVGALKALTDTVAEFVRALGLSGSDADNFRDMAMSLAGPRRSSGRRPSICCKRRSART